MQHRTKGLMTALLVIVLLLAASPLAQAAPVYGTAVGAGNMTGSNDLVDFGTWANNASVDWTITNPLPGLWLYQYQFSEGGRDLSHVVLELTAGCGDDRQCVFEYTATPDIKTYGSTTPPNHFMPAAIYGVKFNFTGDSPYAFSFYSNRAPVWGNFYAQDGVGDPATYAYNAGLLDLSSESTLDFVARPNGDLGDEVPEPAAIALAAFGLTALVYARRRKHPFHCRN